MPPFDALIEGIGEVMERALAPEGGGDSEVGKAIVRRIAAAARQQQEGAKQPSSARRTT
jgi:TetR/AcrR family acrAB operon transcriptional repressor